MASSVVTTSLAAALLLLLPQSSAAFVPSPTQSFTSTLVRLQMSSTMNATETRNAQKQRNDPFINNFLHDLQSQGDQQFVRYDKSSTTYGDLLDTSMDDFINKYSGGSINNKGTSLSSQKMSNLDAGAFFQKDNNKNKQKKTDIKVEPAEAAEGSKFERYDRKKFGSMLLGEYAGKDFVNKEYPQSNAMNDVANDKKTTTKKTTPESRKDKSLELDGVQYERFNRKKANKAVPKKKQDPVHATQKGAESNAVKQTTVRNGLFGNSKKKNPVQAKATARQPMIPSKQEDELGVTDLLSRIHNHLGEPKRKDSVQVSDSVRAYRAQKNAPKPKGRVEPPSVTFHKNKPKTSGRFQTPGGADVTQHIKPATQQQQTVNRPVRPTQPQSSRTPVMPNKQQQQAKAARKPMMPPATMSLTRPLSEQKTPSVKPAPQKTTFSAVRAQPAPKRPVIPTKPTTAQDPVKTRQNLQAQRNREALLNAYQSVSDEELLLYGMTVSGNQAVEPETMPTPQTTNKIDWDQELSSMDDSFQDFSSNWQVGGSVAQSTFEEPVAHEPRAESTFEEPVAFFEPPEEEHIPKPSAKKEETGFVQMQDAQSSGFGGFSLVDEPASSAASDSTQGGEWWKRKSWDDSKEVVIRDYAGAEDEIMMEQQTGGKQEEDVTLQTTESYAVETQETKGDIGEPRSPGFVGFSDNDWSQRR